MTNKDLKELAKKIRCDVLDMAIEHKDGHIAPSYSTVELLVALFHNILTKHDKFILSKGHGCLSYYAVLRSKGFNPTIRGHPDIEENEGVPCTTGSLGHGLPIGLGMAFARKFLKKKGHFYVITGDGECQEGTIWESLNLAKKFKLDNLTVIVDNNKLQALTTIKEIMDETNLPEKFRSFGFDVREIDGHSFDEILGCLKKKGKKGIPLAIIAHTIKGKSLSFMEQVACWHSKIPEKDLLKKAREELK